MSLKDDLIAAKALIDTPEKWRKDAIDDDEACCAIVATNRIAGTDTGWSITLWRALFDALPEKPSRATVQFGVHVGAFNDADTTTHADIMALFDRAIEAAGAR